jgi:hypothetical protein
MPSRRTKNTIRKTHSLGDIVSDEQRRKPAHLPNPGQQIVHIAPGQSVKRAKRLIKQQHSRTRHQRAGQRYALSLPTGEHSRPVADPVAKPDIVEHCRGAFPPTATAPDAHILQHPLPRQEPRVLEQHS